jgi:hypothetical protein
VTTDSRVRIGMVVGVLVVGVMIGVLLGFVLDSGSEVSPQAPTPSAVGPGPTTEVNGVPVGYARTEEGAVAAAANFNLLSGRDDLLDRDALTSAMQTLAAPSWKGEAAKQAKNGYDYVAETYGDDADVSTAVLRYDLADFTSDHAVVKLWTVTVLSGSARPNVDQVWGIVTIDLEWVNGDWRVEGIESSPGPAPVDLPSGQPEQPARALMEDFDEFEGAPVP